MINRTNRISCCICSSIDHPLCSSDVASLHRIHVSDIAHDSSTTTTPAASSSIHGLDLASVMSFGKATSNTS